MNRGSVRTRSELRDIDSYRSKSPVPVIEKVDPKEESVLDLIQNVIPVAFQLEDKKPSLSKGLKVFFCRIQGM